MVTRILEPFPRDNALVTRDGKMAAPWQDWFDLALLLRVQETAPAQQSLRLTAQDASIGTTALLTIAGGLYRVNYYVRVTRAATTSSSIELSLIGTDGAVVVTQTTPAVTGNTTASVGAGTAIVQCDAGTPLSYATTYGSVGATTMQYAIQLIVEALA